MTEMRYYTKNLYIIFAAPLNLSLWKQLCLIFIAVLAPYATIFLLLMAFILIDMMTGITASYKKIIRKVSDEKAYSFWKKLRVFWKNIKSRKLRYTAEKMAVYMIVIVMFSFFEYYFLKFQISGYTLSKIIVMMLVVIEIHSICENVDVILNKNIFSKIFHIFKKKISEKIPDAEEFLENTKKDDISTTEDSD